jgi:hypothetical protein
MYGIGLRVTTTQSGLNKFLQILLPLINKQFQTIHLPDMVHTLPALPAVCLLSSSHHH